MSDPKNVQEGFVLSSAAMYSFRCQEVFPDIISFAAAIPDNLKQLFLIPVQLESSITASVAAKIASNHVLSTPTGDTPEGDLFSYQTLVNYDNEPTELGVDSGSIFDIENADNLTHHQEYNFDENIQAPIDTSYMSDIDTTQYTDYPYRSKEKPRHSSVKTPIPIILKLRLALSPGELKSKIPDKIEKNSKKCNVSLTSYDKKTRVFTFAVNSGNGPKDVKASLSDIDEVSLSCNCKFWRYNGPEFHASENSFMLGQPYGTASPPNIRDPDRKYWLCKHAAAVLKRLDYFVQEISEENLDLDENEIVEKIDEQWDRLEGVVQVPEDDFSEDDIDIEVDWDAEPEGLIPDAHESHPEEEDEDEDESLNYDVDTSDFDEPVAEDHPYDDEDQLDYEVPEEVPEDEQIDYESPEEPEEDEEDEEPEEEPEEPEEPEDDYESLAEPEDQDQSEDQFDYDAK